MKRIAVTVSEKTAAELDELVRLLNGNHESTERYCSHGLLARSRLFAMLSEDADLVISRPGSWEGSHMAQVLSSHGYEV
ncbi:hypothetical protein [Burkholderia cepacia]|uniref:hypothetical protein n=1 Tax=Burkholderia cepacia TaxID=292 RepID=UPI000F5E4911|nr:hypothetical protein [Burkholderia cepacia]